MKNIKNIFNKINIAQIIILGVVNNLLEGHTFL